MKRHSILYGRIAYSLIIVLAYLIGRSIPVPWTAAAAGQSAAPLSAFFGGILGENAELTLFSVGLTPWIVAAIAAQALNPLIRKYTNNDAAVRGWLTAFLTLALTVALAVIQVQETEPSPAQGLPGSLLKGAAVILLTAGTFCIVWLARRNEDWGIGGQRLLIAINLADSLWSSVNAFRKEHTLSMWGRNGSVSVIFVLLLLLTVIFVTVYFQKKEYRFPVHRLMIDSRYAGSDYLAIRYNPAGTMPVMYTIALFSLLSSYASACAAILPTGISDALLKALGLSSLPGALLFVLLLRVMTGVAAAFTIDPVTTADDLKRSGGYMEGVHPGKATEDFLREKIRFASNLSSAAMGLIIVLPYAYGLIFAGTEDIGNIAVSVIFLTGILIELAEECVMYCSMQDYRPILGVEYRKGSGQGMRDEIVPGTKDSEIHKSGVEHTGMLERGADDSALAGKEKETSSTRAEEITDAPESRQRQEDVSAVPAEQEKTDTSAASDKTAAEKTQHPAESASPNHVETQPGGKYCFVPVWQDDPALSVPGDIIAPAVPAYDDIVHQMKMFHNAGEQAQLWGLAYLPQMRHFLHRYYLEDLPFRSIYDELQGIDPTRPERPARQRPDPERPEWGKPGLKRENAELAWSQDGDIRRGCAGARRVFDVHLLDDSVYYVEHYDEESDALWVDRRSIYDDRGFLSSSIEYVKSEGIPAIQRFYNPDGKEQFHITYPGGQVAFAGDCDCRSVRGAHYENAAQMLADRVDAFLEECGEKDVFFLAAQGEADDIVRRAERFAQGGRKVVLSFYEGRYAQLKGKGAENPESVSDYADDREGEAIRQYKRTASMIFADTKMKKEYFERFEYVYSDGDQLKRRSVPVEKVCPFAMESRTGRSGSIAQDVIFMPADGLFDDDIPGRSSRIIKHIGYLMKEDINIQLWLGTEKESVEDCDEKRRKWFRKYRKYRARNAVNLLDAEEGWAWQDETKLAGEEQKARIDARNEVWRRTNNELEAMHRRIRVVSYRTEKELDHILEETRLVLDPRKTPDLRLQTAAICYGIPQVVFASSGYVLHTENGYICSGDQYIADGLHYYLDGLANWNHAHEICAHIVRKYPEDCMQQVHRWKRLIGEAQAGQ